MTTLRKKEVILNLFQDLPIGLFVVAVILESCCPGSAVTQKKENNRFWTATFQNDLFLIKIPGDFLQYPVVF
ncbi:MAG TPA: hypothetical protein DCP52_02500 [Elusimicrobia bacterium]|nr:hypothetical protein [Elusimicrobiota bacterium]